MLQSGLNFIVYFETKNNTFTSFETLPKAHLQTYDQFRILTFLSEQNNLKFYWIYFQLNIKYQGEICNYCKS